jgi:succinyl-CoA synthetase beta subunit
MQQILVESGIQLVPSEVVLTSEDALVAAERFGYPVVAKLLATTHSHKSDAGLVRVNLANVDSLDAALAEMILRVPVHEGILIQKMAGKGVEVLIGVENDPQFGPVVACGVGGVLVELLGEVALRLPPIDKATAQRMLHETRLANMLAGYRGACPADAGALAELLVKVGDFAMRYAARLRSLDFNPVIVHESGLSLVDARIQWSESK